MTAPKHTADDHRRELEARGMPAPAAAQAAAADHKKCTTATEQSSSKGKGR